MERSRFPRLFALLASFTLLTGMIVVADAALVGGKPAGAAESPPITVDSHRDMVHSGDHDWSGVGAVTQVEIRVSRGGVTFGPWAADLDGWGHFGMQVPFDIRVGDDVIVNNGLGFETAHTVLGLTAAYLDAATQDVTGSTTNAPDGTIVTVHARTPDGLSYCEQIATVTGGAWLADFSSCGGPVTPFVTGDPWTNAPSTNGDASFTAPDGNDETTDWSASVPAFWADPQTDSVGNAGGCQWGSGSCGSITGSVEIAVWQIGSDPDADPATITRTVAFSQQPGNGDFGTELTGYDLLPGDIVRVGDGVHPTKQLVVASGVAVTGSNATAKTVSGTANADDGATVVVEAYGPNQGCRQFTTVEAGEFTADFSTCDPAIDFLTGDPWTNSPSTGFSAFLTDADHDATQANGSASVPGFSADPETDWVGSVGGCQWGNGRCGSIAGGVQIAVWHSGSDPNNDSSVFGLDVPFTTQNGDFGAQLIGYDLLPGDIVRVSDGRHPVKQLTVAAGGLPGGYGLAITDADATEKIVTGIANADDGTTVVVDAYSPNQGCRRITTVEAGEFTADFSTCDPAIDFLTGDPWTNSPSTGFSAFLLDADRDATQTNWSSSVPVFQADAGQDWVNAGPGCQWGTGNCGSITGTAALTIHRGGTQVFPPSGSATTPIDPWGNWNFNLINQPYNQGPKFDFQPGDQLTVTDGTHTKVLVVTAITSFGADPAADKVYGTANPALGDATVFVNPVDGPNGQCTTAEATFDGTTWTADFGVPDCYDLSPMSFGGARQVDADGDASFTNWQVPWFGVNTQGDQVSGNGWGAGNTVTVSITPVGGDARDYTVVVPTTPSQYGSPGSFQLCTSQGNPSFCTLIGSPALDIQPGATITVSHELPNGAVLSSTHVVTALLITGVDAVNNVVRGTATPGLDVQVSAQSNIPGMQPEQHTVTPDPVTGAWSEQFTLDIVGPPSNPSTFIGASQIDPATNDRTQVGWGWGQASLILSPSSNFADGTVVTVQGIGWRPGAPILVGQCRNPVGGAQDCSPANSVTTTVDATFGDFTVEITLAAQIVTSGGQTVDCTGGYPYCTLAVSTTDVNPGNPSFQYRFAPLVFGEPATPQMTVMPNSDLSDGDVITVHLTGYPHDSYVNLGQCTTSIPVQYYPGGPTGPLCVGNQVDPMQQAMTDASGELIIDMRMTQFLITRSAYTVTPDTDLVDGQQVTVEGHGYRVADCTTPAAACYFQAVVMQGGPMMGAPPVALSFAPSAAVPTVDVRQNFLGHVQGGTPPDMYSYVVWPNETAGATTVPLVSEGGGTWGFTTQYTVSRYLTAVPEPPYQPSLDTLSNPIDCANLPTDLPEGNSADCIIDVFPHGATFALDYVMDAQHLQFTVGDSDGVPAAVENAGPNGGDGNDDGILDSLQGNVTSLPGALDVDGNGQLDDYVTIESPAGTSLGEVTIIDTAGMPGKPAGVSFPVGLIDFTVNGVTTAAPFDVKIFLSDGLLPVEYWKYQAGAWSNFTAHTNLPGNNPVVLTLQDKTGSQTGYGDDNATAGVVHDPGAPAVWEKTGVLRPLRNPPAVNKVRAGSVVVVKFELGGDRGLDIFANGYPASAQVMACGVDATSNLQATVGAGNKPLSYHKGRGNKGPGTYEYKWDTEKSWKGTCRQLVLQFADGTTLRVNFEFK